MSGPSNVVSAAVRRAAQVLEHEGARAEPVVNVKLAFNIGGDRGLEFLTHVSQDAPLAEQHAMVDRLMALAERQRLKHELHEAEVAFAKFTGNRDAIVRVRENELASLTEELDRAIGAHARRLDEETERHNAGRRGEFKESQGLVRLADGVAQAQQKIADFRRSGDEGEAQYAEQVRDWQRRIAEMKAAIERLATEA